ncbi:MAG TPA: EamA family transporter [Burkholderiaceae bacterium]|nr:EamA family transporter [Burkholderiaceae bacterium]
MTARLLESPRVLFWVPTLIWASTWHVILYQLAEAPPLNSVAWRFLLAGVVLLGVAVARGQPWLLAARWHGWLLVTGVVQYSVNYWAVYEAERHIPSGLVAVLFSLMVFGNALIGWRVFGQRVTRRFVAAAVCGVAGVVLIFWPEVVATGARPQAALGLALGMLAVTCACIGNALTLVLSKRGLSLVPMLGWCMTYGALALWLAAASQGTAFAFGASTAWWLSLLYLTLFGSVIAFFVYFRLAQRVGPARAAMTGVMIPPIALAISAALEGWQPSALSWAGIALCLGSVYAATRPSA